MQNAGLVKNSQWSAIDGELCLITNFHPMLGSKVENGVVFSVDKTIPYASVSLTCRRATETITGFITHKLDFQNLWAVFQERGLGDGEEALMYWTQTHYTNLVARFFSATMPKVIVMVCKKGTYESVPDSFPLQAGIEVMVCVHALMPIEWKVPDVIK